MLPPLDPPLDPQCFKQKLVSRDEAYEGPVNPPRYLHASGYLPQYDYYPPVHAGYSGYAGGGGGDGPGGRKGPGRGGDEDWSSQYSGGDEKGGEGDEGDDEEGDEGHGPPKKVAKKTPMACHFCRGRKLKCDGGRPTCGNCARRGNVCAYDDQVRRRGPGRKTMMKQQEGVETSQPHVSSYTTSLASSLHREPPPLFAQVPELPGPPPPDYPYPVGQIPRPSARFEMQPRMGETGSSSRHVTQPQRMTGDRPHQLYLYERAGPLYSERQAAASRELQSGRPYTHAHPQAGRSGPSHHGPSESLARERDERGEPSDDEDDEDTSGS